MEIVYKAQEIVTRDIPSQEFVKTRLFKHIITNIAVYQAQLGGNNWIPELFNRVHADCINQQYILTPTIVIAHNACHPKLTTGGSYICTSKSSLSQANHTIRKIRAVAESKTSYAHNHRVTLKLLPSDIVGVIAEDRESYKDGVTFDFFSSFLYVGSGIIISLGGTNNKLNQSYTDPFAEFSRLVK